MKLASGVVRSWSRVVGVMIAAGSLPAAASAQIQVRRGSEFQVNAYTTGVQSEPAVAVGPGGDFVAAWSSYAGPEPTRIMARRFGPSGVPVGPELVVSTPSGLYHMVDPAVAATRDGEFVIVWSAGNDTPGDRRNILGRVVGSSGQLVGPAFVVNEFTFGYQWEPAIAADASGNITVAWSGEGDVEGISARRMTHRGLPLTPQVEVNTWTTGVQTRPSVASTALGEFTVVWQGDPSNRVFFRRFTEEAQPILGQESFNTNAYDAGGPAVASDASGNLFMASVGAAADGNQAGVNAIHLLPDGGWIGGELVVNSFTTGSQWQPSVAEYGGNFVVVWTSDRQDGSNYGIYGQRYDEDFERIGLEFRINSYTASSQHQPAVASDAKGNWVAVWTSGPAGRDGDSTGIFAQAYAPDTIFDSSFETGDLTHWFARNTDGGDLSVTTAAALNGLRGLQAVVDDTAGLWVQDDTPADEPRYRARFYFDTNGFDPGEALNKRRVMLFVAFEENPNRRLVTIVLRRLNGAYSVRGTVRLDDHTLAESPFVPVSDGTHYVEFDWRRATGPDAEDGLFALWVDGTVRYVAPNIDNSVSAVDFVRMGAITVKPGASGTLYLDHFRSRRVSPLGSF